MKNKSVIKVHTDRFDCVSVILGAVDEAVGIRSTVHEVLASCEHKDIAEFIIMQSRRITPECLQSICTLRDEITDVPVKIYVESEPFVGSAIRDGIGYSKGSHTALMASDFGIAPECLARMIEEAKHSPDSIIKASRRLDKNSFVQYSHLRLAGNFLGNKFLSVLFRSGLTDITNAQMLFPTDLYKTILWHEKDFTFLLEATLKPLRLHADFREVPVRCLPRTEGKSKNSAKKTLAYLPAAIKYRFMPIEEFYPPAE